ncbi:MAG: amino acid adenylation domain-containing protein [Cyanobacteria bacterium SID2]|nr:amino acid adenylation domain-containing protein [Cyanobacteria bacterium SID2]MBP0003915.1 amino acid adenylation domain-containing protein [Cyanobacteria bacterium SBC]
MQSQNFAATDPVATLQPDRVALQMRPSQDSSSEPVLIHRRFEAQVDRSPDAIALDFEGQQLTYADLNRRANQLAYHLKALGVGPEVLVGICVRRSLDLVVGLLGILKAGGAYVPLDPQYPQARLALILEDAQAPVLLTQQSLVESLPPHHARVVCLDTDWGSIAQHDDRNPVSDVAPTNLAYAIYTSGSTGKPKGVAIEHRNTIALVEWASEVFPPEDLAGVLASTSICFDLSVFELFVPLSYGGKVILAQNALHLPTLPSAKDVTLINTVPSAIAELLRSHSIPASVRTVNLAGEPLPNPLVQQIYEQTQAQQVFNLYGPSEDTTYSTYALVPRESNEPPSIGRPIRNTQVYLLDDRKQPVAPGEVGELYVGGSGIARGYLNRPELTAERFVPNLFATAKGKRSTSRLYKTGDLARYRSSGDLEYLGRIDHQVKIRGFRIELGEIEAALWQHPEVRTAVAIVRDDLQGDRQLVAYVVSELTPERLPLEGSALMVTNRPDEIDRAVEVTTVTLSCNGVELANVPECQAGQRVRLRLSLPAVDCNDSELLLSGRVTQWQDDRAEIQFDLKSEEQSLLIQSVTHLLETHGHISSLQRSIANRLRRFLQQRLPDYMVPNRFVLIPALPLMPNGKVDRRSLPAPKSIVDNTRTAPQTATEAALALIWADVLGLEQVGIHDSFLDLGGHSLLAARLVSRIRDAFQVELPLRYLFELPTVHELAERLETVQQSDWVCQFPPVRPASRSENIPLSLMQEQLWFLDRLVPNNPFYNVPEAFRLNGPLDAAVLEQCLQELIDRHEALRTTFSIADGQPVQVIHPSLPCKIATIDLRDRPEAERETEMGQQIAQETWQPFDLSQGPLLRATLYRLSDTEHVLLLNLHHIICDEWSIGVLLHELATLYTAAATDTPLSLPENALQYADFAIWQRQWLQGEMRELQLSYWKQQLSGRLPVLQLPIDRSRPPVPTYRGARQFFSLSESLTEKLKALSDEEGVTPFVTLLAAFQTLLYRYTGQEDILIGSPMANRPRSELEGAIGFFVNTLVLRTDLSGTPSFRQLLARVQEVVLGALTHQNLPFKQLVQELHPDRDLNQNPLFQVLFNWQNVPVAWPVPNLTLTRIPVDNGTAKFDLFLELAQTPDGISGYFEYSTDLFEATTIERMVGHFQTLLEGIVADRERSLCDLSVLTAIEHQQLAAWNATEADYPEQCAHHWFEAQVERTPDEIALVFGHAQLTYRELNQRANQLAHYLQLQGVGPDIPVGLCVERSIDTIVGLLGILKAGGAYLPLDPTYPAERLTFMLENASVSVLVTQSQLVGSLPVQGVVVVCLDADWPAIARCDKTNPASQVDPDGLAYVIYTSGSTGQPKGVAMPHRPLTNLLAWQQRNSGASVGAKTLQFAPISFDVSFQETFATLGTGGILVLMSEALRRDSLSLLRFLDTAEIDRLFLPFVALQHLAEVAEAEGIAPTNLREVITAGEQLRITSAIANWFNQLPNCTLYNHYGPSESHVVTAFTLTGSPAKWPVLPPIGRPIANTEILLLDAQKRPVPVGVPGELYIGGTSLARGYLNRPDLSAERFISNPHTTSSIKSQSPKLYKTGDLARYLPDGNIEYLGRSDQQVKIRGFRIEPGEVEARLEQHPRVREAVAIAREDVPGDKRLVAYIVPESAKSADESAPSSMQLRQFLQTQLPEYMVPSAFVCLDRLPLTPSGKVNRRALPAPDRNRPELAERFVAPRTEVEKGLADLWIQVLNVERVGIYDNFFHLGGHSLRAIQLVAKIRDVFQVDLMLQSFFEAPTIEGLAQRITACQVGMDAMESDVAIDLMAEVVLDPAIDPKAATIS